MLNNNFFKKNFFKYIDTRLHKNLSITAQQFVYRLMFHIYFNFNRNMSF